MTPTRPAPPRAPARASRRPHLLALVGVVLGSLLLGGCSSADPTAAPPRTLTTERLHGADRWSTAVAVGKAASPTSSAVVLASGETSRLVDGMVASTLAAKLGAPLLLTSWGTLPAPTAAELTRRSPTTVYLVGGTAAISAALETQLRGRGMTLTRVAGADRYATAAAVAALVNPARGTPALVVNGTALPDGLASGGVAAATGHPILLVGQTAVPAVTRTALTRLAPSSVTVVGGTGVISSSVLVSLPNAHRVGGANRSATTVALAKAFASQVPHSDVVLAAGTTSALVDALPAGTLKRLVLFTGVGLPEVVRVWLDQTTAVQHLVAVGGPAVLSAATLRAASVPSQPLPTTPPPTLPPAPGTSAPSTPPAAICGTAVLRGPSSAPAGAVTVTTAQNLDTVTSARPAGTTFWLTPGVHTLGTDQYAQVTPKTGNTYLGAPGAVLDGQHKNLYAFVGGAPSVTIKYLTIQNFGAAGDNNNEGVVNHDSATGWQLAYNTIQKNAGAGAMIGSSNVLRYNCLRNNGQYGFNAYNDQGVRSVTMDHNEISGNNTDNWEVRQPGCGCSGGGKFWETVGATVTNNYVHNNKGAGLWADSNNSGFLIQGNYISGNDAEALFYETSYNAAVLGNTFLKNGLVQGPANPGFPTGAIYLSESGSDRRAPGPHGSTFQIAGNRFVDNWGGVILWENADRFAGSPANTSTGITTLVNPTVASLANCSNHTLIAKKPYFDDCRWKTQNVAVTDNHFSFTPAHVGAKCTVANACGFNGVFSQYGTFPDWSPYKGTVVENHITFAQNNRFDRNTYTGPWRFMIFEAGNVVPRSTWSSVTYGQDPASTFN